jgi:hypothetical protein
LGESIWALLKALDILACTLWLAPLYVVGLADRPSGRQMISSYVGEAAANGMLWGRIAATLIDMGAVALGDDPDHCHRAFIRYRNLDQ